MNWVVIDTETTGVTNKDRVLEISVITIDPNSGKVLDEFDTLVNPLRDISNSNIHGVLPEMISSAPTFEDIHVHLANILHGSIFVAHNIPFDSRFLANEYARLGVQVDFGKGFCTLSNTKQKLNVACSTRNIEHLNAHRSLGDARATAKLAYEISEGDLDFKPINFQLISGDSNPRTYRRDHFDSKLSLPTTRQRRSILFPTSDENEVSYLDVLDFFFEDSHISSDERISLNELAKELGISEWSQNFLHKQYLNSLVIAAKRDGIFSQKEREHITGLVQSLNVDGFEIPDFEPIKINSSNLSEKVCFTGEAVFEGASIPREKLEAIASQAGFTCVNSVSKKNCTLVVAANVHTMSGKAKKARDFGIPVISVEEFFHLDGVSKLYAEINKKPDWF